MKNKEKTSAQRTLGLIIHPDELDEYWIEAMRQNGVQVLGIHPTGGPSAAKSLPALLAQTETPAYTALLRRAHDAGLVVETFCHAVSYLLPRDLFDAHPEWFRQNAAGERTPEHNFCVTNEEARACLADACAELARRQPAENHRYHIWLDDIGADGVCHCPVCRHLSPADQALLTVNTMLAGLRRVDPEAKLGYLSYLETMQSPPTAVRPAPGVYLEYAPISRDYDRPLDDPDSEKNRRQLAPLAALLRLFGTADSTAIDYWTDNSLFSGWKKPPKRWEPCNDVARRDLELYREAGIEHIAPFACYLGADYRELYGAPQIETICAAAKEIFG